MQSLGIAGDSLRSLHDLTVKLNKDVSYEDIKELIKNKSQSTEHQGIIGYTEDQVVSSDFIGDKRSSVFDERKVCEACLLV